MQITSPNHSAVTSITVILCSHNGQAVLPATLDSLAVLKPPCPAELILVDNASTDGTWGLLQRTFPHVRVIRLQEPRRGKSHALNRALDHATGDLIVFTDDDTRHSHNWLPAYLRAANDHPQALCFAGQIRPHWAKPPARWQTAIADRGAAFACSDVALNHSTGPVAPCQVKGPNFAIRGRARGLRFDTERLNYHAGTAGGEDTDLASRAAALGPVLFVPGAWIQHHVRRHQMSVLGVMARGRRLGRARWLRLRLDGAEREQELKRIRRRYWKSVRMIFRSRSLSDLVFWMIKAVFWRAQISEARGEVRLRPTGLSGAEPSGPIVRRAPSSPGV